MKKLEIKYNINKIQLLKLSAIELYDAIPNNQKVI